MKYISFRNIRVNDKFFVYNSPRKKWEMYIKTQEDCDPNEEDNAWNLSTEKGDYFSPTTKCVPMAKEECLLWKERIL